MPDRTGCKHAVTIGNGVGRSVQNCASANAFLERDKIYVYAIYTYKSRIHFLVFYKEASGE